MSKTCWFTCRGLILNWLYCNSLVLGFSFQSVKITKLKHIGNTAAITFAVVKVACSFHLPELSDICFLLHTFWGWICIVNYTVRNTSTCWVGVIHSLLHYNKVLFYLLIGLVLHGWLPGPFYLLIGLSLHSWVPTRSFLASSALGLCIANLLPSWQHEAQQREDLIASCACNTRGKLQFAHILARGIQYSRQTKNTVSIGYLHVRSPLQIAQSCDMDNDLPLPCSAWSMAISCSR